jgi:hypothetical protein
LWINFKPIRQAASSGYGLKDGERWLFTGLVRFTIYRRGARNAVNGERLFRPIIVHLTRH